MRENGTVTKDEAEKLGIKFTEGPIKFENKKKKKEAEEKQQKEAAGGDAGSRDQE